MTTTLAVPGNTANTFLTHFFGGGLEDGERYLVERFKAMVNGDIRRCPDEAPAQGNPRSDRCRPSEQPPRRTPALELRQLVKLTNRVGCSPRLQ